MDLGSPPRVWGYRWTEPPSGRCWRFTPTRVGISRSVSTETQTESVHPHACGDIRQSRGLGRRLAGSPPRVWGYLEVPKNHQNFVRFTPTRVGISEKQLIRLQRQLVHPHACGDIGRAGDAGSGQVGSPPRVWGYLCSRCKNPVGYRFTPTRVGISIFHPDP